MILPTAEWRGEFLRLIGACAGLIALSAVLGGGVHLLRPAATRLPWKGDWDAHIETKAFNAGIPIAFLNGVKTRLSDGSTIVFDARTPELYVAGHLPGARSLPLESVSERLVDYMALLTMETPLLVYCDGEDCSDSLELAIQLREFGFSDVTLYPGGVAEWKEYKGPLRKGNKP